MVKDNMTKTLLIATSNFGKFDEINLLVSKFIPNLKLKNFRDFDIDVPTPVEDGNSFEANALIKAKYYFDIYQMPVLSDDSGLCISALNGAPGIYSADWADHGKNFPKAIERIEEEVNTAHAKVSTNKEDLDYSAYFSCAFTLYIEPNTVYTEIGQAFGSLDFSNKNDVGFGYDPIFVPDNYNVSYANLANKNEISHRYNAFCKILPYLKQYLAE